MSAEDVVDILAVDLLGVIPDEESVVIASNHGEPVVGSECSAGNAYMNIARRILGETVPLMELESGSSFIRKFTAMFKKK